MCGIVGQVNTTHPIDRACFECMCHTLAHRGPDAEGVRFFADDRVALGHRRLAIIDLTDSGLQPMTTADGHLWISFNGEIYNYRDLRHELEHLGYVFRSNSDTEVILNAYTAWGTGCLDRLRGIFAFGIWDADSQQLWVARDHLGVKPLYYFHDSERFIFASELKAILADSSVPRRPSKEAISDYLTYGYVPHHRSIFEQIAKLPAGHHLLLQHGKITITPYWDVAYTGAITDEQEAITLLQAHLQEAISMQLVSDVPVGVLLSGGVDSSAITAYSSWLQPTPLHSFTIGFAEQANDESQYAAEVAAYFRTLHHHQRLDLQTARDLLPLYSKVYDEPFYDSSGLPTYLVSQMARQTTKVVLGGDGGDEVFAGYHRYGYFTAAERIPIPHPLLKAAARLTWRPLHQIPRWRFYAELLHDQLRPPLEAFARHVTIIPPSQTAALLQHHIDDPFWLLRRFWHEDYPRISAAQYLDLKTYLVDDILTKIDRASMAHGLEVRVPLLDYQLVEAAFSIDARLLFAHQQRKSLLRKALHGVVPDSVLTTRKQGFAIPLDAWFAAGLRTTATDLLTDGGLAQAGIVSAEPLQDFLAVASHEQVWTLYALEAWFRQWIA
ncbi:MAG: asparagine synthase (glutamine-hydrolyzing) [Anaerolineales bacterium]|nr:asparagine synthase (glutamine-hydrolyzing) [Anaerolineales bacterium]